MNIEPFKIKLKNDRQSEIVQEFMINNGWVWAFGENNVKHEVEQFLYFDSKKIIKFGWTEEVFNNCPLPRLEYNDFVAKYITQNK